MAISQNKNTHIKKLVLCQRIKSVKKKKNWKSYGQYCYFLHSHRDNDGNKIHCSPTSEDYLTLKQVHIKVKVTLV